MDLFHNQKLLSILLVYTWKRWHLWFSVIHCLSHYWTLFSHISSAECARPISHQLPLYLSSVSKLEVESFYFNFITNKWFFLRFENFIDAAYSFHLVTVYLRLIFSVLISLPGSERQPCGFHGNHKNPLMAAFAFHPIFVFIARLVGFLYVLDYNRW